MKEDMRRAKVQIEIDEICMYPGCEIVRFGVPCDGETYVEFTGAQAILKQGPVRGLVPKLIVRPYGKPAVIFSAIDDMDSFVTGMSKDLNEWFSREDGE